MHAMYIPQTIFKFETTKVAINGIQSCEKIVFFLFFFDRSVHI